MIYPGSNEQIFGHVTYSQHGEDLFLLNLFTLMGIDKPSYLDIGAHKPYTISNTALFYSRGSSGVCVEANPSLIYEFNRERSRDRVINAGVAAVAGTIAEGHPVTETKEIEMITINDVVRLYCGGVWPDLLCMDIEGFDCEVLNSAQFYKNGQEAGPKVICTEIRIPDAYFVKVFMGHRGYHSLCRIMSNLIFVRSDFIDKVT
jgi:hypothetical protein